MLNRRFDFTTNLACRRALLLSAALGLACAPVAVNSHYYPVAKGAFAKGAQKEAASATRSLARNTERLIGGSSNEKVKVMATLAKTLGHDASVGAMQANFGTMFDALELADRTELIDELIDAKDRLAAALDIRDPAAIDIAMENLETIREEIADAISEIDMYPGPSKHDGWAYVDLDYNNDGAIDQRDLDSALSDHGPEKGFNE